MYAYGVIGDKVFEDYKNGCGIEEIAKKYDRKKESVKNFILYREGCGRRQRNNLISVMRLKRYSDLYKDKLNKIRREMTVGKKIFYEGKSYIVIGKYERFVVLQGKEYQITAMYGDFIEMAGVADG